MKAKDHHPTRAPEADRTARSPRRPARFHQLIELAQAGDQNAVADLFREFQFKFGEDRP
ncbi:MAG: hypothetical protein H6827_10740 [Planctomycetes bacterium]|nr:hypothetical protein [Planctomycetota bacterium]